MLLDLHLQTESKATVTNTRTAECSPQTVLISLFAQPYPKGSSPTVTARPAAHPPTPGPCAGVKDLVQPQGCNLQWG